jgi:hypothetical protein
LRELRARFTKLCFGFASFWVLGCPGQGHTEKGSDPLSVGEEPTLQLTNHSTEQAQRRPFRKKCRAEVSRAGDAGIHQVDHHEQRWTVRGCCGEATQSL